MNSKSAGRPKGPEKVAMKLYVTLGVKPEVEAWYGRHKETGCGLGGSVPVVDSGQSEAFLTLQRENERLRAGLAVKAKETPVVAPVPSVAPAASGEVEKLRKELREARAQALAAVNEGVEAGNRILELENEVAELQAGFPDTAMQNLRARVAELEGR